MAFSKSGVGVSRSTHPYDLHGQRNRLRNTFARLSVPKLRGGGLKIHVSVTIGKGQCFVLRFVKSSKFSPLQEASNNLDRAFNNSQHK